MQSIKKGTENASIGWVWRMVFGLALIGLSFWGMALCQELFRTYTAGPATTALETSSAKLAGWVAWFVFFGPIGAAGLMVLLSGLRKLGTLDQLRGSREEWIAQEIPSEAKPHSSHSSRSEEALHDGLESLGDEEVAQLTKRGQQTAVVLGLFAGGFFVLLGVFGLMFATQPIAARLTIDFAVASGVFILAGLAVLRRTFRKEDNTWLIPLKLFTQRVLRLHSAERHKTRRSERVR